MRFIVEYYTNSGLKRAEITAESYREVESIAAELENDPIQIKCIREYGRIEDRKIS
ncbi:MAG: hypothetical protein JWN30_1420 [Bacilli bacterium]|nr:hypothetical protein [Bacilli bacterium]